jgi:hypothetical protein
MKKVSIVVLQGAVVLLGVCALVFMLWEPHLEGRNVHATLFEMYFKDLFLAYVYASSILFFTMLYQIIILLGHVGREEIHSQAIGAIFRTIRHCASGLIALILGAETYFFIFQRTKDDIAGGVAIGLFLIVAFAAVAISTVQFEKHLHKKFLHRSP